MMPGMNRRQALLHPAVATALAAWAGPLWPGPARPAPGLKVLRLASESETGFDPARVGDVRSLRITSHIFEPLLEFDPLARPVKLRPRTAAALPEPEPGRGCRSTAPGPQRSPAFFRKETRPPTRPARPRWCPAWPTACPSTTPTSAPGPSA